MSSAVPMRCLAVVLVGLLVFGPGIPAGHAQAPVAGEAPPAAPLPAQQLEELVGRIALYPDDLVAIILPASTFPLDVVQADRFLQKVKQDKNLKPDQRWDESIRNLLNYPEVVSMMSQDLDWTQDLGEAVVSQQADVIKAIQAFRAKAANAGNLKSDDKQIVVQENNVIQIVPADPEVIYVPQYQPTTVVVTQPAPAVAYYPAPYPSYYYPYPPGYAFAGFATGFFVGAATAYACNWGGGHVENNVNINNTQNMSMNRNNQQIQQKTNEARQRSNQTQAQRGGQAGQAGQTGRGQGQAAGQGGGQRWQSQKRPGEVSQGRVSAGTRESRPGYGGSGASRGDSFGSGGRGSDATRDANRGTQSRGGSASTMEKGGAQPGGGSRGGASASTMDRGGGGGGSASTMDKGGSRGGGGSASMGSGSRGGGGAGGSASTMDKGGSRGGGGGGGGGSRGGSGGGGGRGGGRR